jgi:carboxypeptidase Taq
VGGFFISLSDQTLIAFSRRLPSMSVIEEFRKESETICLLQNTARVLNWDQQIVMPQTTMASQVRGRQKAVLSKLAHERLVADSFGDLLARVADALGDDKDSDDALTLAAWRRERRRATAVSGALVERLALASSEAFNAWRHAKEASDFSLFEPHLDNMVVLKRQEAQELGYSEHPYDAMLDEFEPGMLGSTVRRLFAELRPHLAEGVRKIAASPRVRALADGPLDQEYEVSGQEVLARRFAQQIGFPAGNRIDVGAHPFCSAASSHDVRLVTRYHPRELPTALFATLHEAGHGLYELHSPDRLEYTPLRGGASLGVHESQSRLWENLVGRSESFWKWAFPQLREVFPRQTGGYAATDFYRAVNRVRPSLIRVEADEVTYSLHVILRFEIEVALIEGLIQAKDVPALWNEKMKESLGVDVPDDARGCLQDIHWSDGLIGYFPTYVLGNLVASDLWLLVQKAIPDVNDQMSRGQFGPLLEWLIANVYGHAGCHEPEVLVNKVLGHGIIIEPFVTYLQSKYSKLYDVDWS